MYRNEFFLYILTLYSVLTGGSAAKNLPAVQEMWVQSPGQEDPLEKEMAIHSSTLAWEIPMDRGGWRDYSPWDCKELDVNQRLKNNNEIQLNLLISSSDF